MSANEKQVLNNIKLESAATRQQPAPWLKRGWTCLWIGWLGFSIGLMAQVAVHHMGLEAKLGPFNENLGMPGLVLVFVSVGIGVWVWIRGNRAGALRLILTAAVGSLLLSVVLGEILIQVFHM